MVHTFFQVREWCHLRSAQILPFDCNLNVGLAAKGLGTRLGDFAPSMAWGAIFSYRCIISSRYFFFISSLNCETIDLYSDR